MIDYSTFWQKVYRDSLHSFIEMIIDLWPTLWPIFAVLIIGLIFTLIRKKLVNWFSYVVSFNRREARKTEKRINGVFDLFSAFRDIFPKN